MPEVYFTLSVSVAPDCRFKPMFALSTSATQADDSGLFYFQPQEAPCHTSELLTFTDAIGAATRYAPRQSGI